MVMVGDRPSDAVEWGPEMVVTGEGGRARRIYNKSAFLRLI